MKTNMNKVNQHTREYRDDQEIKKGESLVGNSAGSITGLKLLHVSLKRFVSSVQFRSSGRYV
jgi:hypothetical protein